MLAARRLSEAQLRERLTRRAFEGEAIDAAVAYCRREGFLNDALFARLYVETRQRAVGNRRLIAELVQRGIPKDLAHEAASGAESGEDQRLEAAIDKLYRVRTNLGFAQAARALERLGFPASAIYARLRLRAAETFDLSDVAS